MRPMSNLSRWFLGTCQANSVFMSRLITKLLYCYRQENHTRYSQLKNVWKSNKRWEPVKFQVCQVCQVLMLILGTYWTTFVLMSMLNSDMCLMSSDKCQAYVFLSDITISGQGSRIWRCQDIKLISGCQYRGISGSQDSTSTLQGRRDLALVMIHLYILCNTLNIVIIAN